MSDGEHGREGRARTATPVRRLFDILRTLSALEEAADISREQAFALKEARRHLLRLMELLANMHEAKE
jgi:hypothetical protein